MTRIPVFPSCTQYLVDAACSSQVSQKKIYIYTKVKEFMNNGIEIKQNNN